MAGERNERLRAAMAAQGIELENLARQVEVDPKTVQRWIGGRVPHPRHRWKICDLLGQAEEHLSLAFHGGSALSGAPEWKSAPDLG